jgi:anti-sigma B factor antagonist
MGPHEAAARGPEPLTIAVENTSSRPTLHLHGELDVSTAAQLRSALLDVSEGDTGDIAVNLSDVRFMDSTALGVLVAALKRQIAHNTRLVLISPPVRITKTLDITGLSRVFPIERP